jgi:hypothetical protein
VPTVAPHRRAPLDALRSLKKYAADLLGGTWEVRLWGDRGEYKEPFAVVMRAGDALFSGSAVYADVTQAMAIHCYPQRPDDVDHAIIAAGEVEDALVAGFQLEGVGLGRPRRVPLYDFAGVPLEQSSSARYDHDFMRVVDFSTSLVPDPLDARLIRVVADLRCTWRRGGRYPRGTQVVQDVKSQWATG